MGCVVLSVIVPAAAGAMVTDLALALRGGVLAPSAPEHEVQTYMRTGKWEQPSDCLRETDTPALATE